jgi:hypothetical protein
VTAVTPRNGDLAAAVVERAAELVPRRATGAIASAAGAITSQSKNPVRTQQRCNFGAYDPSLRRSPASSEQLDAGGRRGDVLPSRARPGRPRCPPTPDSIAPARRDARCRCSPRWRPSLASSGEQLGARVRPGRRRVARAAATRATPTHGGDSASRLVCYAQLPAGRNRVSVSLILVRVCEPCCISSLMNSLTCLLLRHWRWR